MTALSDNLIGNYNRSRQVAGRIWQHTDMLTGDSTTLQVPTTTSLSQSLCCQINHNHNTRIIPIKGFTGGKNTLPFSRLKYLLAFQHLLVLTTLTFKVKTLDKIWHDCITWITENDIGGEYPPYRFFQSYIHQYTVFCQWNVWWLHCSATPIALNYGGMALGILIVKLVIAMEHRGYYLLKAHIKIHEYI